MTDRRRQEEIEGFVVDLACLRRYAVDDLHDRASVHTRECALMPHCVESGYGIVTDDGRVVPLDTKATVAMVDVLRGADLDRGIRVRVVRKDAGDEMKTESIVAVA